MLVELLGGPADGMILDCLTPPPRQFILPQACHGIGSVYVTKLVVDDDFIQYCFTGYCSLRYAASVSLN